jgi:hypothetical protein
MKKPMKRTPETIIKIIAHVGKELGQSYYL